MLTTGLIWVNGNAVSDSLYNYNNKIFWSILLFVRCINIQFYRRNGDEYSCIYCSYIKSPWMHIWLPHCQTVHWDLSGRYTNQDRVCQQVSLQIQSRFLERRCEGVNASTVWFSTEDKGKHALCRRTRKVFKRQPKNRGRENWNIGCNDVRYGNVLFFILHSESNIFFLWRFDSSWWFSHTSYPSFLCHLSKVVPRLFNNLLLL